MARNAVRNVEIIAIAQQDDPVGAFTARLGERGKSAAETAACMAMVSIAEDLHRIAELLGAMPAPAGLLDPEPGDTKRSADDDDSDR
jgi:hypothetical protein